MLRIGACEVIKVDLENRTIDLVAHYTGGIT
jgi:hypothetical protein